MQFFPVLCVHHGLLWALFRSTGFDCGSYDQVSALCKLTLSGHLLLLYMDLPAPLQYRACPHNWDWQRGPSAAPKRSGAPCVSFTPGQRSTAASSEAHSGPCSPSKTGALSPIMKLISGLPPDRTRGAFS